MIFHEAELKGAFVIDPERLEDDRGFFARVFCQEEFAALGLATAVAQRSISYNRLEGTLRGMHYQAAPHQENKLVRCTSGAIHDVIIDLRPSSPTYLRNLSVLLSSENRRMLYLPGGFAHGFLTLCDDTEVAYQMDAPFHPGSSRGVRWNDPAFSIEWPAEPRVISERDASYPDFAP